MTTNATTNSDIAADHDVIIGQLRTTVTNSLSNALTALTEASAALDELGSNHIHDIEFTEGHTGDDVEAFLTVSLRYIRAAHALARHISNNR